MPREHDGLARQLLVDRAAEELLGAGAGASPLRREQLDEDQAAGRFARERRRGEEEG